MSTQDEAEEIERARCVKNFALKNEGLIDEDQNTIDRKDEEIARKGALIKHMELALDWYAKSVRDCRKLTPDGDSARSALDKDGGKIAMDTLARAKSEIGQ